MKTLYGIALLLALLFAGCTAPVSSRLQYADRYQTDLGPGERLLDSDYQTTTAQLPGNRGYVHRLYYPDTKTLIEYTELSTLRPWTREGQYRSWSDEGNLRSEGKYTGGERSGRWVSYHADGTTVQSEGNYAAGKQVGTWKSYHKNGVLMSQTEYTAPDTRNFEYRYDTLGAPQDTLLYQNGELLQEVPGFERVERMPVFGAECGGIEDDLERKTCSESALFSFLSQNLRYPPRAREREIEGLGIVSFVVEKDGTLNDVAIVRGVSGDIRQEILRIIELMPRWEAGMKNGKKVRVQFTLPVRFRLE